MAFHADLNGLDLHSPSRETVVGGSGGDIANLTCVKVVGMGTFWPKVEAANPSNNDKVAGIIITAITEDTTGSMWTVGRLTNINTSQWSPGTKLFCDTSGQLNISPTDTILKATVIEQHSASGAIYVYNTITMDAVGLSSVGGVGDITASAGDVLVYDGATWSSTALSGVGALINLSSLANVGALTPSAGDILSFDGTNWSAVPVSGIAGNFNLSAILDVVGGTGASNADVLTWTTSASAWGPKAAAGGGGGSFVLWNDTCGNAPVQDYLNGFNVRTFGAGLSQTLYGHVIVPQNYQVGEQMSLIASVYATATGQIKLIAEVYLVKMGVDAISSTANHYSSTNAVMNITGANIPYRVNLPLTDSNGQINSINICATAGAMLTIALRAVTDSACANIPLLQDIVEVDI